MRNIKYAVGKYLGRGEVDVDTLKYFDDINKAEQYYLSQLHLDAGILEFKNLPPNALAIFTIVDDNIVKADYLCHLFEEE